MKKNYWIIIAFLLTILPSSATQKVYLIHGFGSAPIFMTTIERFLTKNKFSVVNYGYPSLTTDLTICGESLYVHIQKASIDTVSFVTHSTGTLVLRSIITKIESDTTFPKVYRIIMIAPPNHGAEIADFFAPHAFWRFLLGPNISNLATDSNSLANRLPIPKNYDLGIIIGVSKNKNGYNPFIKGNNDGYLTPESAKLGTEKENIYVDSEHSMIIHNQRVLKLVHHFLLHGKFE